MSEEEREPMQEQVGEKGAKRDRQQEVERDGSIGTWPQRILPQCKSKCIELDEKRGRCLEIGREWSGRVESGESGGRGRQKKKTKEKREANDAIKRGMRQSM